MAISTVVCRGFGSFGGGINEVPRRGYYGTPPVNGPLIFPAASIYRPGMQRGTAYRPGIKASEDYRPGMMAGEVSG